MTDMARPRSDGTPLPATGSTPRPQGNIAFEVTLFPGDTLRVNGAELTVDRAVRVSSTTPLERLPVAGLVDLPETPLRIGQLWHRHGPRALMTWRHDLRCPCGSVYMRRSATHHSCPQCQRVWDNLSIEDKE